MTEFRHPAVGTRWTVYRDNAYSLPWWAARFTVDEHGDLLDLVDNLGQFATQAEAFAAVEARWKAPDA